MPQSVAQLVLDSISNVDGWTITVFVLTYFLGALLFGYLIAFIALKPTREALSSQKQFIGNIAHELRTPLSVIKTNMEVALLEGTMDKKMREFLVDNVDELDRSSDIINNLLSFNTIQNPEEIVFANTNLGSVIDGVLDKLKQLANSKNIYLSVEKGEFLIVWGNESALEQIAMNVIKNALVYTERGGVVHIALAPNYRGYIELLVSDNGLGINQGSLLHVFEPFYRADESRARQLGGSGLGLTIVSELVKLHGGKISIKSAEGEGTTVFIAIPCGETKRSTVIEEGDGVIARDFSKHRNPKQAAVEKS